MRVLVLTPCSFTVVSSAIDFLLVQIRQLLSFTFPFEGKVMTTHSVHPPPFYRGEGERGLSLQPNFQKGGLDRTSSFTGGFWEREGDFFQGGCNCHIKNKLKSEIFNEKKSH